MARHTTVDTSTMYYDVTRRQLVAEASDLGDGFRYGGIPETVDVRSHRTGRVVRFVYVKRVDAGPPGEKETVGWRYRVDPDARPAKTPAADLADMELMVFND